MAVVCTGAGREFLCRANVSVRAHVSTGHGAFITRGIVEIGSLKRVAYVIQIVIMLNVFAKLVICHASKAYKYCVYCILVYKLY